MARAMSSTALEPTAGRDGVAEYAKSPAGRRRTRLLTVRPSIQPRSRQGVGPCIGRLRGSRSRDHLSNTTTASFMTDLRTLRKMNSAELYG